MGSNLLFLMCYKERFHKDLSRFSIEGLERTTLALSPNPVYFIKYVQ